MIFAVEQLSKIYRRLLPYWDWAAEWIYVHTHKEHHD